MPERRPLLIPSLTLVLALASAVAGAQNADKLSDAERARRDAEKVFSFIKFHTVKPAAAPKPAPVTAAKPAAPRPAAAPVATTVATASSQATPAAASPPGSTPARSASAPAAEPAAAAPVAAAPTAQPAAELAPAVATSLPPASEPAPAAEAAVVEEEEVPLKLIAYVAPEMNAQVLAAISGNQVVVPVRFIVQPDGRVSEARSTGSAPRRVAIAAVRAVQQWRFDPIPAVREVDVELAFKAGD